mmetsp:Transcript_29969/g.66368  ORF Transcript_29969/g.66368 Transcript_29969/m.66368 type:complete len:282 (-) Transcript_29969:496-1341(-)
MSCFQQNNILSIIHSKKILHWLQSISYTPLSYCALRADTWAILASTMANFSAASAAWARTSARYSCDAFSTNLGLASCPLSLAASFSTLTRCLARRASSLSTSNRPAMGKTTCSPSCTTRLMAPAPPDVPAGTASTTLTWLGSSLASRQMDGSSALSASRSPASLHTRQAATLRPASTPYSARALRTLRTTPLRESKCERAAESTAPPVAGQGATIRASPLWGRACHNSSVTKGMKGCSSRSTRSMTYTATARLVAAAAGSPPYARLLLASMYQSANSSQK